MRKIRIWILCCIYILGLSTSALALQGRSFISGKITKYALKEKSEIIFRIYKLNEIREKREPDSNYKIPIDQNQEFNVHLDLPDSTSYVEFELMSGGSKVGNIIFNKQYLIETRDSIGILIDLGINKLEFSGRGSDKLNCQFQLYNIAIPLGVELRLNQLFLNQMKMLSLEDKMRKDCLDTKQQILATYRNLLNSDIYNRIYIDMISAEKYSFIWAKFIGYVHPFEDVRKGIEKYFSSNYDRKSSLFCTEESLETSPIYIDFLIMREVLIYKMIESKKADNPEPMFLWIFNDLKQNYAGTLRDRLIISAFYKLKQHHSTYFSKALPFAIDLMSTPENRSILLKFQDSITAGTEVFPYLFQDVNKNRVGFNDFKDKIVVMDFWFTGCSACTKIPPVMKNIINNFKENKDIVYLSVNTDASYNSWDIGLKSKIYSTEGQIDLKTAGAGKDDPFIKHYNFSVYPQLFIIGKNGLLISSNPPDPRLDDGKGIIELINKAL